MMTIIFFVFTLVTWPILLPVDAADVKGSPQEGLNTLSWSNITPSLDNRLAAHIVIIYILTFFVFWMIRREMLHFVHMRHQFLISKSHSHGARARTVLVTALPDEFGEEHALREFASFVPGGIDRIWIYRDSHHLNELFEERQKACAQLEKACAQLLRLATKTWNKRQKAHKKEVKVAEKLQKKGGDLEKLPIPDTGPLQPKEPSFEFMEELVPQNKRPKHKVGMLHVLGIGQKVDTIEYCKVRPLTFDAIHILIQWPRKRLGVSTRKLRRRGRSWARPSRSVPHSSNAIYSSVRMYWRNALVTMRYVRLGYDGC